MLSIIDKMKRLNLKFSKNNRGSCQILIGKALVRRIGKLTNCSDYTNVFIITDKNVSCLYLKTLLSQLPKRTGYIVLPVGDTEKNIDNIRKIWIKMFKKRCDRKSLVINLGGGVISDIGGFAASTYMRGIDHVNISTTLLSAVDAGFGGKNGINFLGIKNLIGTFSQEKMVIVDTDTIKTLPEREIISGFAEIIKHGLILNRKYFEKVTSKHPIQYTQNELENIIAGSCRLKSQIVLKDETEKGIRKSLNFGHTVGHAIESLSLEKGQTPLLHGETIGIGMCVEARASNLLGILSDSELMKITNSVRRSGLPTQIPKKMNHKDLLIKMSSDKKNEGKKINFTLLKNIGKVLVNQEIPKMTGTP